MFLEFMEAHAKKGSGISSEALKVLMEDEDSGVDASDKDSDKEEEDKETEQKKSSAFAAISDLEVKVLHVLFFSYSG